MTTYTASIDKTELNNGNKCNYIAGENLTAGDVVKLHTTDRQVVQTDANTDTAIGMVAETTTSGDPCQVLGSGCRVQTTQSLTAGTAYEPAASGGLGTWGGADQRFCVCDDGTSSASVVRIL
jgi:hypothetical protein